MSVQTLSPAAWHALKAVDIRNRCGSYAGSKQEAGMLKLKEQFSDEFVAFMSVHEQECYRAGMVFTYRNFFGAYCAGGEL